MHAAIRRYNAVPNAGSTIAARVNEELIPALREIPGFVSYELIDGGDGTLVSVSVFDDRAAADESTRRATAWVRERLAHLIRTAPTISAGEVVAHSVAMAGK